MSDDTRQLLIFSEEGKGWKAGKTQTSIRFVEAAEKVLQTNRYSGTQLKRLVDLTHRVKSGQWIITYAVSPAYALDNYARLVACEVIL